ncbi:MAG: molecular chaperone HtpG, partial [Planctomycetota bacterium]|nr:molecular chaperone HtpG [Planctomycetota bacterium]
MTDDWKEEILARLQKSLIYDTLKIKCAEKDSEVITLVDSAVSYAYQRTKTIIR